MGKTTTAPDVLFLDKNFLSFTGSSKVFDQFGSVPYTIQGKIIGIRNRKNVIDAATGELAFVVQKKLIGMRKTYEIYRSAPAYVGQASTERADGTDTPLYRFAWVQKALFGGLTEKYLYALQKGEGDPTVVLEAQEVFLVNPFAAYRVEVTKPKSEEVLAHIGKATKFHMRRDAAWAIEVTTGMDLQGVMAFALGINNIREDIEDESDN